MATSPSDLIAQGHYARKQLHSRSRVVAWSHGRRFEIACELAALHGGALLDYGCGDGTLMALLHGRVTSATGTDADAAQLDECRTRLGALPDVGFISLEELRGPAHQRRYDVVTCMEVLEHCPADVQALVLRDVDHVMADDGRLIISVPIETGPTLAVKQAVRAFAAATGLREYAGRERYRPREFVSMLLAGAGSQIDRVENTSVSPDGTRMRFHGHKGFNWRTLERLVARQFVIERRLYSPVPIAGPWLNSQVWFVCRRQS